MNVLQTIGMGWVIATSTFGTLILFALVVKGAKAIQGKLEG